jgi:hypothetical protein
MVNIMIILIDSIVYYRINFCFQFFVKYNKKCVLYFICCILLTYLPSYLFALLIYTSEHSYAELIELFNCLIA